MDQLLKQRPRRISTISTTLFMYIAEPVCMRMCDFVCVCVCLIFTLAHTLPYFRFMYNMIPYMYIQYICRIRVAYISYMSVYVYICMYIQYIYIRVYASRYVESKYNYGTD